MRDGCSDKTVWIVGLQATGHRPINRFLVHWRIDYSCGVFSRCDVAVQDINLGCNLSGSDEKLSVNIGINNFEWKPLKSKIMLRNGRTPFTCTQLNFRSHHSLFGIIAMHIPRERILPRLSDGKCRERSMINHKPRRHNNKILAQQLFDQNSYFTFPEALY